MVKLDGVFIICGAGRGLGRTLALEAAQTGFPIALISRTENELKSLADEIKNTAPLQKLEIYPTDLSDSSATERTFTEIKKTFKSISVLVNCAATWNGGKTVNELSESDFKTSLDLNFFSSFNTIKEVLKLRDKNASPLAIINIGATASLRGGHSSSAFSVAKGAVRSLSQSMAKELSPKGVHVAHLIIDGLIDNPRTRRINPQTADNKFIKPSSIAKEIIRIALQNPDSWTFEWDIRTSHCAW